MEHLLHRLYGVDAPAGTGCFIAVLMAKIRYDRRV